MAGHVAQTIDRYLELTSKTKESLKSVVTSCIDDHQIAPEEFEAKGELSTIAARVVLKALYVARIARLDVMWTINMLARQVTKWNAACDRRLHRLICYLHHSKDWAQKCYVGDKPEDCSLSLFCDASFAGDLEDSKSTSGCVLCLIGPNTFVPISWFCKKQGAVSHSTTEAEVISLDAGARLEGLPALIFWDLVLEVFAPTQNAGGNPKRNNPIRAPSLSISPNIFLDMLGSIDYVPPSLPITYGRAKLYMFEDNDAVIKMVVKGRFTKLRHVARTHRVDLDWLFERISKDPSCLLKFVGTKEQLGDILTKGSFTQNSWQQLLDLIQIAPFRSHVLSKHPNKIMLCNLLCTRKQTQASTLCVHASTLHSELFVDSFSMSSPPATPVDQLAIGQQGTACIQQAPENTVAGESSAIERIQPGETQGQGRAKLSDLWGTWAVQPEATPGPISPLPSAVASSSAEGNPAMPTSLPDQPPNTKMHVSYQCFAKTGDKFADQERWQQMLMEGAKALIRQSPELEITLEEWEAMRSTFQEDPTALHSAVRKLLQNARLQNLIAWKDLDLALAAWESLGPNMLAHIAPYTDPVEQCMVADSTLTWGPNKSRKASQMAAKWPLYKHIWADRVKCSSVHGQIKIYLGGTFQHMHDFIVSLIDLYAGGNPEQFPMHILLTIAFNKIASSKGNYGHEPEPYSKMWQHCLKLCRLLERLPRGSVTLIGPGTAEIWHMPTG